ncbi:MAG TPA: hypothetical protein VGH83_05425 [Candidatus Acidoferrum sp.]|jgi:hypothetical protein
MIHKIVSRRLFLKNSITGGVAAGLVSGTGLSAMTAISSPPAGGLSLKVIGDSKQGFCVVLLFNGQPVAQHAGEFSACFKNEERSVADRVQGWKPTSWSGGSTHVTLSGECKLPNLNTTVFARIDYEVVTPHVVQKKIRLQQSDMFMLFYQLANRLHPTEVPSKFWSFDSLDWQGQASREYFPAAGFRTKNGVCLGLLTDSGYRNQWTRMIRRDGRPVKPAPARVPDANLYSAASLEQRRQGDFFIQQTFGELLEQEPADQNAGKVTLPQMSSWNKRGKVAFESTGGVATLTTQSSDDGVLIPFAATGGEVYALNVKYRSPVPVALEIWNVDEQLRKMSDITLYDDALPESPEALTEFHTRVFIPGLPAAGCAVVISIAASEQGKKLDARGAAKIEVQDLEIRRVATRSEPYHRLEMDRPGEKTVFVFADENVPDTLRGHRLASQTYLADGLRFQGGETEKVVYADLMMLSWIASPETFRPILAPSIWYSAAGEMYLRDSFFALNGIHNRELNVAVFNLWAENQGENGAINTLIEPNLANVERKSNDSTPLWLMWALLNKRRFGTMPPLDKMRKAAEYCLKTYDPQGEGLCSAQFVMGQLDVIRYPEGTSVICENQGVLAVTLRVIKELQISGISETIQEARLNRAEELYRGYYDVAKKFMRPERGINDAIGFAEIFPEFLSLWLFRRKILTDEMVINHLDHIPPMMPRAECPFPQSGGTVRPILIGLPEGQKNWSYFTENWHPMISDSFAASYANHGADGIYYNGGSWMRIEVCGYVTGMLHGWAKAREAIANRLWAELNIAPDFPTSQEYIATDPTNPFYGYHRVFAWNSFICQALELAGLRTPEMDPDYPKK